MRIRGDSGVLLSVHGYVVPVVWVSLECWLAFSQFLLFVCPFWPFTSILYIIGWCIQCRIDNAVH